MYLALLPAPTTKILGLDILFLQFLQCIYRILLLFEHVHELIIRALPTKVVDRIRFERGVYVVLFGTGRRIVNVVVVRHTINKSAGGQTTQLVGHIVLDGLFREVRTINCRMTTTRCGHIDHTDIIHLKVMGQDEREVRGEPHVQQLTETTGEHVLVTFPQGTGDRDGPLCDIGGEGTKIPDHDTFFVCLSGIMFQERLTDDRMIHEVLKEPNRFLRRLETIEDDTFTTLDMVCKSSSTTTVVLH